MQLISLTVQFKEFDFSLASSKSTSLKNFKSFLFPTKRIETIFPIFSLISLIIVSANSYVLYFVVSYIAITPLTSFSSSSFKKLFELMTSIK